jgi:hypothetical protein
LRFRHRWVRGFIIPGACSCYIGVGLDRRLFGVLGFMGDFMNPRGAPTWRFDLTLKADTVNPGLRYGIDLLLYALRTKQVQDSLEHYFTREIKTCYSLCFSSHPDISRYRKHGERIVSKKTEDGYRVGYLFQMGEIPTLKAAKALWMQKHGT